MKSFTLIEFLIAVVIFFLVSSGVIAVFNLSYKIFNEDVYCTDLQQQARNVMNGMTREIRQSSPGNMSAFSGYDRMSFSIPGISHPIEYSFVNGTIIREHPENVTRNLISGVSNVTFCVWKGSSCCDPVSEDCTLFSEVLIDLVLAKTARQRQFSFSLREKVRLRND